MKLLTRVNKSKEKLVYEMELGEFEKGEWLKLVPSGRRAKIEYTSNNRILIIDNTPRLQVEKIREGGQKNDKY